MAGKNDATLVRKAVAGDDAALQQLLSKHHRPLVAHISSRLSETHRRSGLAEDVAQETYIAVFRDIGSFDSYGDERQFFSWLCRVANNRMLDMLKRLRAAKRGGGRSPMTRRRGDGGDRELIEMLAATMVSRTPSRSVARREAIEAVQRALDTLKPEYREALHLRYIQGLPVADVAAKLDRSAGAVLLLCNRGLKRLRAAIGASIFLSRLG
jgi:RNA polymerase sigma-70 factor (ECF subfamily)